MPRVAANTVIRTADNSVPMQMEVKPKPDGLTKIQNGEIKKKVPNDVMKRRRNYRLSNLLKPKAPINVLTELTKQGEVTFEKPISDQLSHLVKVSALYDEKTFEGVGPTKNIAKNICSEAIVQYIAFKACEKDAAGELPKGTHGEEETPWTALARLALFKMFNDWQAQGAVLPRELMSGKGAPTAAPGATDTTGDVQMKDATNGVPKKREPKGPQVPKVLPEDAATRHPVSLLHEMCGALNYESVSEGVSPNFVFHMSVLVKDQKFTGTAKSKKEAKKNCATEVMRNIYGVNYPPVIKTEQ